MLNAAKETEVTLFQNVIGILVVLFLSFFTPIQAEGASDEKVTGVTDQKIQFSRKLFNKPDIQLTEPLKEIEQNSEVWEWVVPPEFDDIVSVIARPDKNSSYIVVKKDRKKGVYDTKGNVIAKLEYENFNFGKDDIFSFTKGRRKEEKCGYMNISGKVIIQPIYKFCSGFNDGITPARGGDDYRAGFIDPSGKLLSKRYDLLEPVFSDGLAFAQNEGEKCGYLNRNLKFQIPQRFTKCQTFNEGLAVVYNDKKKCGYINTSGKMVIKSEYTECNDFSEGLALVKTGKTTAAPNNSKTVDEAFIIDKTGKKIFGNRLSYKGPTFTINKVKEGMSKGFIKELIPHFDATGGFVEFPFNYGKTKFKNGFLSVVFYPDNKRVLAVKTELNRTAWAIKNQGYINRSGELTSPIYAGVGGAYRRFDNDIDEYDPFSVEFKELHEKKRKVKDGSEHYGVYFSDQQGYIRKDGTHFFGRDELMKIIPPNTPIGDRLQKWSSKHGSGVKYGYIDTNGKTIIPPQFDFRSRNFHNGFAIIEVDKKYGVIKLKETFLNKYEKSDSTKHKKGLGVQSLYCDEDALKTLAPNIEKISFIERNARISFYTIFLKNGTKADYETLETNAYNLCMLAIKPPDKKSDSINEAAIQSTKQPKLSSLQAKYKFPCKVDSEFLDDNKIFSEIKHAKAREFIKEYLQENSLQKLYSSLNCVGDAITLNPEKVKYWVTLGKVHSEMAAHKVFQANTNAIQAYQQALELDVNDTATMLLLAVKLTETSQYKDALKHFETALKKTPYLTTYNTIQWMNIAYLAGSQTKRGTLFYEQMIKENPELYYLYIFKANLHQAHFDFTQARKDFLKVINNENAKHETKNIAQKLLQAMNSGGA